jgi:DNA uptake protein ComE-like DNA-binding protein
MLTILALAAFVVAIVPAAAVAQAKEKASAAQKADAPKKADAAAPKKAELVDLNTATRDQLVAVPNIGATIAQKIIDNRPYKSKDELVSKKVVTPMAYAKFKDYVIAKQDKSK